MIQSRPLAKLTNRLKSPNAFGVSDRKSAPPSVLAVRESKLGKVWPDAFVGENSVAELGEVIILSAGGSISSKVKKEVSERSPLVEVTERKMSRSFC